MANANIDALYVGSLRIKYYISITSNFTFYKWCVTKVAHCSFSHFLGNLNYYNLPIKYLFPLSGNLIPLLGNLNCYLLPGKYHFPLPGSRFHFLGNLNYYLLPGKYAFPTSRELVSTSWEISIITFYQVNTPFPLLGNSLPLPGKSQLVPYTR